MAALLEGATPRLLPFADGTNRRIRQVFDPASVTAGLVYVRRCLRAHQPFGVITGSVRSLNALLLRVAADCAVREDLHTVRIASSTDSVQVFLSVCLAQLGFELNEPALDDLHNLMVVFLRHESARGRRTVVILEDTDHCGPHVLELMKTLSSVRAGATPAITFVLTGSPGLHRILNSPGMAGLRQHTRQRFDIDDGLVSSETVETKILRRGNSAVAGEVLQRSLAVMRDGKIVERRALLPGRLLIGRSGHSGLRLESRYVSRNHAALLVTSRETVIVDLQSTNATLVNGQVTASQKLEPGDLLSIGDFRLRFDCRRPLQLA
ncbi:MAG: FHA domain-containing protein [Gammaproteobacteria bacterium]|nr:FHA domain-containing protein [Gammaproteobacteria bacterium]